jgi:hypothetical protein
MLKAGAKVCYETKNSSSGHSFHFLHVREGSKETPLVPVVRAENKLYFHTIVNVFCCLYSKIEIGKQRVAIILAALVLRTTKLLQPFATPTCSQIEARLEHLYISVYAAQFICILYSSFIIDLVRCLMRKICEYNNASEKYDCSIHP